MSNEELSNPITFRLPKEMLAQIEAIAGISERTRSWIMVRALRLYLAGEGAEILQIAEGMRQLDEGESEDLDAVIGEVERIVRGDAA